MGRVGAADTDQMFHTKSEREFEPYLFAQDGLGAGKGGAILRLDIL